MRRPALGALAIVATVSACSQARTPLAGDAAADGAEMSEASPDAPLAQDGSEAGDDSDVGDASEVGTTGSCPGPVVFRLEAPDPSAWLAMDAFDDNPGWLSLHDAAGVDVFMRHYCISASCGSCAFDVLCEAAFTTDPVPTTRTWDGTIYPLGHCGANATACVGDVACALPGHYDARMCAERTTDPNEGACVDVPFDLPASGPVVGTLPP
jgi:hypothetical protein